MGFYISNRNGKKIYVTDEPGTKGTIIAIHGLTGNHKQLRYFQEILGGDYRFISYDLLGRGRSDIAEEDTSIDTHARDLEDIIQELDVDNPILIGYSMGAYICATVARRSDNVSALVLLDGGAEPDKDTENLVVPSLNRLKKIFSTQEEYIEETRTLYTKLKINWNAHMQNIATYEIQEIEGGWEHVSDYEKIKQDFMSFYNFDGEMTGMNIDCPTFLLVATGSMKEEKPLFKKESYKNIKGAIDELESTTLNVNHYELVFNPQPRLAEHIYNFLEMKGES